MKRARLVAEFVFEVLVIGIVLYLLALLGGA